MRKAEERLAEEEKRVKRYLNPHTEPKLIAIVQDELIRAHARSLVEMESSGCGAMFKHDRREDLRRMYRLFARVPVRRVGLEAASAVLFLSSLLTHPRAHTLTHTYTRTHIHTHWLSPCLPLAPP